MIATVNAALASIAQDALRAGKHVLAEKPGGISVREIEELETVSKQTGALYRVGYNHRYHPAGLKAREIFESGALGPIMFLRGRYGQGGRIGYDKEWRADPKLSGGGELIDQGVHLIDLAGIFLGEFTQVDWSRGDLFLEHAGGRQRVHELAQRRGQNGVAARELHRVEEHVLARNLRTRRQAALGRSRWSYGLERLTYYKMLPQMGPPETTIWEYPRGDESWKIEMQEFFEDIRWKRLPVPGLREAKGRPASGRAHLRAHEVVSNATAFQSDKINPNSEVKMGSARAARAVFRALAENAGRTEKFQTFGRMSCAKRLDARRVQRHPRRVCSPTSVFEINRGGGSAQTRANRNVFICAVWKQIGCSSCEDIRTAAANRYSFRSISSRRALNSEPAFHSGHLSALRHAVARLEITVRHPPPVRINPSPV
jgi:predicted dehydrogenase